MAHPWWFGNALSEGYSMQGDQLSLPWQNGNPACLGMQGFGDGMLAHQQYVPQQQLSERTPGRESHYATQYPQGYPTGNVGYPAAFNFTAAQPLSGAYSSDPYAAYYRQYSAATLNPTSYVPPSHQVYPENMYGNYPPPCYTSYNSRSHSTRRPPLSRNIVKRSGEQRNNEREKTDRGSNRKRTQNRDLRRDLEHSRQEKGKVMNRESREPNSSRVKEKQIAIDEIMDPSWYRVRKYVEEDAIGTAASLLLIEAIDSPKKSASSPNVTLMIITRKAKGEEGDGYMLATNTLHIGKQERRKECCKEVASQMDLFDWATTNAWCYLPRREMDKRKVDVADWQRLAATVAEKVPSATVEFLDVVSCCIVSAESRRITAEDEEGMENEKPETILDLFDPGFGDFWQEASRLNGLVRKMWYVAVVNVRHDQKEKRSVTPTILGVGFATDVNWAKARAVYAATKRVSFLRPDMVKI